jgi:putative membrane protein insertion efficiency factor
MTNSTTTSSEPWIVLAREGKPTPAARACLGAITLYQRLTSGRIAPCRFYPSCSHYAYEAIDVHGAWRGTGLALRRLSRCRPLGPHGIDLVPESKKARSARP